MVTLIAWARAWEQSAAPAACSNSGSHLPHRPRTVEAERTYLECILCSTKLTKLQASSSLDLGVYSLGQGASWRLQVLDLIIYKVIIYRSAKELWNDPLDDPSRPLACPWSDVCVCVHRWFDVLGFFWLNHFIWQSHISVHHSRGVATDEAGQPIMHQLCVDLIQSMGLVICIYKKTHPRTWSEHLVPISQETFALNRIGEVICRVPSSAIDQTTHDRRSMFPGRTRKAEPSLWGMCTQSHTEITMQHLARWVQQWAGGWHLWTSNKHHAAIPSKLVQINCNIYKGDKHPILVHRSIHIIGGWYVVYYNI